MTLFWPVMETDSLSIDAASLSKYARDFRHACSKFLEVFASPENFPAKVGKIAKSGNEFFVRIHYN